jgi:hypothetical protein
MVLIAWVIYPVMIDVVASLSTLHETPWISKSPEANVLASRAGKTYTVAAIGPCVT